MIYRHSLIGLNLSGKPATDEHGFPINYYGNHSTITMKAILFALLLASAASFAPAKTLVLEICTTPDCYTQSYAHVKNAVKMEDAKGRRFVRITFDDGRLLDVTWADIVSLR